ncbi:MAG: AAA family ATPase, partial [Dysgonamonadaceae bacterium]|nr:AAA family ATPase [Dysgonamonadaceae bacterium]
MNIKRLPYGNSNFNSIRTENYYYVDKTRYIEYLEDETNKYQFFIRPRKFGKSLFFSILDHYYDLNGADDFERLFGDLYIGKHPTPGHNSYLMMQFDFSGLNTASEEGFTLDFNIKIQIAVERFLSQYRNVIPHADEIRRRIIDEKSGIRSIDVACDAAISAGKQIFILIDEYDHFANDLIAMGSHTGDDVYKKMVRANGLVRDFYERLKTATKTVLDRIFITGISPVMLDDLTSGFNIAVNLTLDLQYNEMMGFTQEEVDTLMTATGVDPAFINVDMETYYDGYLFHEDGENRVYNPSMILYFFNQILKEKKAPKNIIDLNLKTDYGRIKRLIKNERNRDTLIQIIKDDG